MKKNLLVITCLLAANIAFAQKIKVSESSEKIGGGSNNALVVNIYEATPTEIEKEWKSLMKKHDAKVSTSDGVFADNAQIKTMGNNTVDIYARVEKVKEGESKLIVAFDLGGAFMSSSQHSEQYKEAKNMVNDFAMRVTKESIAGQLKAAQKVLKELNGDQEDLVDNKTKLEKTIEEYKAKIKKAEEDIVINKSEQDKKKTEIATQQKVVDGIMAKDKAVN